MDWAIVMPSGIYGRKSLEERFFSKTRREGECLIYTGSLSKSGYGQFWAYGTTLRAHRFAWELKHGPIDLYVLICHKCDNKPCVETEHLFEGTELDNMQDWKAKGLSRFGERGTKAILTHENVLEVKKLSAEGSTDKSIALRFGVHRTTISKIITGVNWSHVK